VAVNAAGA